MPSPRDRQRTRYLHALLAGGGERNLQGDDKGVSPGRRRAFQLPDHLKLVHGGFHLDCPALGVVRESTVIQQ